MDDLAASGRKLWWNAADRKWMERYGRERKYKVATVVVSPLRLPFEQQGSLGVYSFLP